MRHPRLTLAFCTLALAVASTAGLAQARPDAAAQAPLPPPPPGAPQDFGHGGFGHPGFGRGGFAHPGFGPEAGVLRTLDELQRLYIESGRSSELPALYNDVLARTHNPMLRQALYQRLARAQLKPANVDAAIATLRKSLAESLADEARFAAGHPHHGGPQDPQPPAPPRP